MKVLLYSCRRDTDVLVSINVRLLLLFVAGSQRTGDCRAHFQCAIMLDALYFCGQTVV